MSSLHPPAHDAQRRLNNVVVLRPGPFQPQRRHQATTDKTWDQLTAALVVDQARRGVLNPAVVEYLVAAVFP